MSKTLSIILIFVMMFSTMSSCQTGVKDNVENESEGIVLSSNENDLSVLLSDDEFGDVSDGVSSDETLDESSGTSADSSKDESSVTSADTSKDESSGTSADASKDESSGTSADASKDESSNASSDASKDESSNPSGDASKDESSNASGDASKDESSNTSGDASKDESSDTSADASKDESSGTSADASKDESSGTSADSSKDESSTSSGNASKDESSKVDDNEINTPSAEIKDVSGYEQYLKVSEIDDVLAQRGFKDLGANKSYKPLNYDVMKACWISQFDFGEVYCSTRKQNSEREFTRLVEMAYDNLLTLGINTVIVQVRPNADSFYPSAYYPWSYYVTKTYGRFSSYDPLKIMIDEAHERGLSFHAWINPMRGMSTSNINRLSENYILTEWAGTRKLYTYSSLNYLNIAYEDVRQLIINGAAEIVRNYNVDGVHMDDYFYFGEEKSFDNVEYNQAKAKNSGLTLKQFRFNNLNALVSGIYSAIKAENPNVMFGISPAGNLNNMESFYYADVKTWLSKDGYLDYIMPQIYFGMEHQTWSFDDTYKRWTAIITNPKIKFMCGMSLGKAVSGYDGAGDEYAGTGKNEWINNKNVFKKCFEFAVKQAKFDGFAVFCYQYMFDPTTGEANEKTLQEINNCKNYMTNLIKGEIIKY